MFKQILVAIDGSPTSNRGLKAALALASDQHAPVLLLHVIDELSVIPPVDTGYVPADFVDSAIEALRERGREVLEQAGKQARDQGVPFRSVLADSNGLAVSHVILSQARKARADLIVLGTHGRRGFRRLVLGSDAENVLREATCPVLLVRAPERAARRAAPRRASTAGKGKGKSKAADGGATQPAA
jgi:nucleotide-binding universal stress UspA family protein